VLMLSAPLIPRFATNATALARRSAIRHSGAIMKADAAKHLPISESKPRQIGILAYPGIELLDAIGPLEVFAAANRILAERSSRNPVAYEIEIWANRLGAIDGSSGVGLIATRSIASPAPVELDTLLVAGSPVVDDMSRQPCVDWLRRATGEIRRVGGICTGVFLLAEAGLLDGRRAVTHWAYCDELARRYPAIRVEPDPIFLRDDRFYTTAGVTAGMDLALALVQDDLGRDVALAIARLLVLFLKRPGGQSQFSAHLAAQLDGDSPIAMLQRWILNHLDTDLTIEALAERVHMSPRNFARHFQREAGAPPGVFVERARLDAARRALEDGEHRLETIARHCGFTSAEILRRLFQRRMGLSPTAYRERFASAR
jgi:transcriptional regulator GlxA family with amidase domain